MNILLLGYGKMGRAIEEIARERGHHIAAAIDLEQREEKLAELDKSAIDAAIEFSAPESAPANIRFCLREGIPVICGTTGWLKERSAIEDYCIEHNGTFFYASNFSIGVNIFFRLNSLLAEMMNRHQDYAPTIEEIHHTEKKDAPSGTAISLAEGLLKHLGHRNDWHLEGRSREQAGSIPIISQREGQVPGTHTVSYRSKIDDIEIRHTAHSRKGFALGAVLVTEWIKNKKGILGMEDFLKL